MIPTSRFSASITGRRLMRCSYISRTAAASGAFGAMVTGSGVISFAAVSPSSFARTVRGA
jgi:hypothetical protein